MNQPRHIQTYSKEEMQDIVMTAIIEQRMAVGYYIEPEQGHTLRIEFNIYPNGYKYRVEYVHGFFTVVFYCNTLTDKEVYA